MATTTLADEAVTAPSLALIRSIIQVKAVAYRPADARPMSSLASPNIPDNLVLLV
jgi:hypothetical protein